MLIEQGRTFGPFRQFRMDLHEDKRSLEAIGFDAGAGDFAIPFVRIRIPRKPEIHLEVQRATVLAACRTKILASRQWADALRKEIT